MTWVELAERETSNDCPALYAEPPGKLKLLTTVVDWTPPAIMPRFSTPVTPSKPKVVEGGGQRRISQLCELQLDPRTPSQQLAECKVNQVSHTEREVAAKPWLLSNFTK